MAAGVGVGGIAVAVSGVLVGIGDGATVMVCTAQPDVKIKRTMRQVNIMLLTHV